MTDSVTSTAMYKPASKLPHWQRESSPSYRRNPLSRRNRLFIIIAILLILCYRHSRLDSSDEIREIAIDSKIARSYPVEREKLAPPVRQPIAPKADPKRDVKVTDQTPLSLGKRKSGEVEEDVSVNIPQNEASPEYAGDDVPRKQAVLNSRKPDTGPSDLMEHEAPALVKQAAEKLIEQHLGPAIKYDKAQEEKGRATISPSQKPGPKRFPAYPEYAALDEKGEALPDIVHMSFEDTTADVVLQGWEDQWYADAELDVAKWGKIPETKIDFVYTCMNSSTDYVTSELALTRRRGEWFRGSIPGNNLPIRSQQHSQ